jgi:hypothetical protein
MNYKLIITGFSIMALFACSKENSTNKELTAKTDEIASLTYSDFENNLKADMRYDSIVSVFGVPATDAGSGIHIYVYNLSDSTQVMIGYLGKIIYARHVDKNRNILHTLIGTAISNSSYEYFRDNISSGMNYNDLVAKFGTPSRDAGSGIHIYVYQLSDGTEIWIGYVNKIIYARHVDSQRNILHTII